MEDGDSVKEHLDAFNTLVIQHVFVNIMTGEEDKCINLFCYLLESWDNLVLQIGSTA
jgi:hypothetical protein